MSSVPQVSDETFDAEVVKSKTPVLVDFYATWCGPCKMLSPVVDEIARDYAGKLKVVKVDTDEAQETTVRFNITSVPTLILFKEGREALRRQGAAPKAIIVEELKQAL